MEDVLRNGSWLSYQALAGSMCGLAGALSPSLAAAMGVGIVIAIIFTLLEGVMGRRGIKIAVVSPDEKDDIARTVAGGGAPILLVITMIFLVLTGSGAAGLTHSLALSLPLAALTGAVTLPMFWAAIMVSSDRRTRRSRA